MKRQSGFTIIELVVVVVLLGILAATALPRFLDLSGDARAAAVQGTAGGLASAMNMARSARDVNNPTALSINFAGQTVFFQQTAGGGANAWPTSGAAADLDATGVTAASCGSVAEAVMSSFDETEYTITGTGTTCTYTYNDDNSLIITYDSSNGNVTTAGL